MAAEKVMATVQINLAIVEVLATALVPGAETEQDRTVNHTAWSVDQQLSSSSTPASVSTVVKEFTLDGSGDADLDLTAAPTTGAGTSGEDLTGKNLIAYEFQVPAANTGNVTIDGTVANGYDLFTGTVTLPKGCSQAMASTTAGKFPAVAATDKIIHFDGTAGDKIRVKLLFEA